MNAVLASLQTSPTVYAGCSAALLTQHGKEALLGPILEEVLGCHLVHVDSYDTDLLGTFTREVPRAGTQLETAAKKARLGMELAGLRLGLGSEGSVGMDPATGLIPWCYEVLVWIDADRGLEVVGRAHASACAGSRRVTSWEEVQAFAAHHRFPSHALVARPSHADHGSIYKGIQDPDSLRRIYERARADADDGVVFLEVDARAHLNPTRQAVIRQAGLDLVARLRTLCPACRSPGFGLARRLPGLLCGNCGTPTAEFKGAVMACAACGHETEERIAEAWAYPAHCPECNP